MSSNNVFASEWRDCLREHYKFIIREDPNPRNHESVQKVLLRPNGEQPPIFSESELQQLYLEATLRAEDLPDDFVPNLALLRDPEASAVAGSAATDEPTFQPHPLECQCPSCIQINLLPHDTDGQPMSAEAIAEAVEAGELQAPALSMLPEIELSGEKGKRRKKQETPKQMSLF
jgi:hypothetical protein